MALEDVIKKGSGAPAPADLITGGIGVDTANKRLYFKADDGSVVSHDRNTPAGNIVAITVQGAINELDTEKAPLASPTFTGTVNSANLAYTGTLTGSTGVVAIGTNQIYKDASGNVGIGTSSPTAVLQIASNATGTDFRSLSTKAGIALNFTGSGISYYDSDTTIFRASAGSSSTERMRIDSAGNVTLQNNISVGGAAPTTVGAGITFPATQAASSNANTLDDYEEGTWTPTYVNFTITSGTSEARYTKVGRVITANIWINATSVSCLANATFTLPIAAVSYSAGSAVSGTEVSGIQIAGSTTGAVREAITTTTNLALTVTYQLAS
jgi:hypothetical protein